jgi:hypothetical protein
MDRPEVFEYGNYGVNVKLTRMDPYDKDVAWVKGNSFVLVNSPERGQFLIDGQRVALVSINGLGEIRWDVWKRDIIDALKYEAEGTCKDWDCFMHLAAFRHFNLAVYVEA